MINFDDFDKAQDKINEIIKLRDILIEASPLFNEAKENLTWYKKVCTEIPEQSDKILSLLDDPINGTLALNPMMLNMNIVTGATGSFHAISGDTRAIIQSYGQKCYHLIDEYYALNRTDDFVNKIIGIIDSFRPELKKYNPKEAIVEAQVAYEKWEAGVLSNSELAANIRIFQEKLYGALHMARVALSSKKKLDESWPKMAEELAKSKSAEKLLKNMQNAEDRFHLAFTKALKKGENVTKEEMRRNYKDYIEHAYAILSQMNMDLLK
jgi:hypothetical protein